MKEAKDKGVDFFMIWENKKAKAISGLKEAKDKGIRSNDLGSA